MINILFIAYEFPPVNLGGTQRPLKFVKYLRDFGINPIVLSLSEESYSIFYQKKNIDEQTLQELPENTDVLRFPSEDLIKRYNSKIKRFSSIYFRITGPEAKAWRKNLFAGLPSIIAKYHPQAILVTCPPMSMASLGVEISAKYNLPFILDMRDAWSQWCISPYGSYLHYFLTKKREYYFLNKASAIIATSDQTLNDFQKLYPKISSEKFHLITNGYDEKINSWEIDLNFGNKEEIVIGYAGSFYYTPEARRQIFTPWWKKKINRMIQYIPRKEDWLYRSPYFFFKALKELFIKKPDLKKRVKVKFAGDIPDWINSMVEENNLQENCIFLGRVSLNESIVFQQSCDVLLITSSKVLNGEDYSIAGKTFEYFSMHKPIIAFVAAGAQKRMLEKSGCALICDPDMTNESAEKLDSLFNGKIRFKPDEVFLKNLSRKELTGQLAAVIKSTLN